MAKLSRIVPDQDGERGAALALMAKRTIGQEGVLRPWWEASPRAKIAQTLHIFGQFSLENAA